MRSPSLYKCQCLEWWNSEKEEWQRHHTLQRGCLKHRALVPNHSVNQLSIYGAVSNRCEQFGLTKEKGQEKQKESVTKGVLTSVKSQEVKHLVSCPRPSSANSLRENIQDFESLSETIRFTRVCELASFPHRVSAGMSYKTRLDEDDGFGQIIPLCREYTLSRVNPQSRASAAMPGGTIIGPVIEVQIVKILDQHGHDPVPLSVNQTNACDTQHYAQAHEHARTSWRFAPDAEGTLVGPGKDTHGTPVPTQWEGRGWLRARPQPPHAKHMVAEHDTRHC